MVDVVKVIQTRAFARQDGAILGVVWIAGFACTMWAANPDHSFWGVLANLLTISTPFVVAKRLKTFRDYALDGVISFKRSLYYCWMTFFNATLLLTVAQFLWFKFLNTGIFMGQILESYRMVMEAYNMTQTEINQMTGMLLEMKPLAWASAFMVTDLVAAAVMSPILAALMSRKVKSRKLAEEQQEELNNNL